jgi:tetratricopeptide (TPR) repeat protein
MIRQADENGGRNPKEFDPRALFRSMERHMSEERAVTGGKAHEAQQLVYDAWEAKTDVQQRKLMQRALQLNPNNVDALLYLFDGAGLAGEEELQALRNIVAAGERDLGAEAFKNWVGGFWGVVETRPYMRARKRLAECLRDGGRIEEAIREYEEMLRLNPNDNQGLRYILMPDYLMLSRLDAAEKLFSKYKECEYSTAFAWCRVLERFLSTDLPDAAKALGVARKQNPHTEAYIKGQRKPPREMPGLYQPGSKDETLCFAENLRAAWKAHPDALQWLEAQSRK